MHGRTTRIATLACLAALVALALPTAGAGQEPDPDEIVLFSIGGFKRLTADPQGRTAVRVLCEDATGCSGSIRLGVYPTRRPVLTQTRFQVPAGSAARIRMTLTSRGRKLLAKKKTLRVLVTANVVNGAGSFGFAELPTTLALVKKR